MNKRAPSAQKPKAPSGAKPVRALKPSPNAPTASSEPDVFAPEPATFAYGSSSLAQGERLKKFLAVLATKGPDRRVALAESGFTRGEIAELLETNREFARDFAKHWDLAIDVAEDEAARRAIQGWEEPIVDRRGDIVGYKIVYDGGLLKELLKANRGKWRGEDAGQRRGVSEEALREMRSIMDEAAALP